MKKIGLNKTRVQESIPFKPAKLSEANIQAEIYHQLKLLEIPCILEYVINNSRFDIIVLDNKKENILLIIECKRISADKGIGKRT